VMRYVSTRKIVPSLLTPPCPPRSSRELAADQRARFRPVALREPVNFPRSSACVPVGSNLHKASGRPVADVVFSHPRPLERT